MLIVLSERGFVDIVVDNLEVVLVAVVFVVAGNDLLDNVEIVSLDTVYIEVVVGSSFALDNNFDLVVVCTDLVSSEINIEVGIDTVDHHIVFFLF